MAEISVEQALNQAVEHHRAGRYPEAESIYKQILTQHPDQPDALHLLGMLAAQFNQHPIAIQLITRAIQFSPNIANYYFNLANSLFAIGQLNDALTCYHHTIELNPTYPGACYNIANTYRDLSNPQKAIEYYKKAIEQNPDDLAALNNIGDVFQQYDRYDEAFEYYKKALSVDPNFAPTLSNIANAYLKTLDFESAVSQYTRAIKIQPQFPEPYNGIGNALMQLGRLDEAITYLEKAIQVRPNYAVAFNNLGSAYKEIGNLSKAIECYRTSIQFVPQLNIAHSNLLLTLLYDPNSTSQSLAEEAQVFDTRFGHPENVFADHANSPDPNRKLRIGYISPDFRNHPVGRFMLPLISRHNHEQFEVFCYAFEAKHDQMHDKFFAAASHWRRINTLGNNQLCDLIRTDQIDILIDLSLHLSNNKLQVFARKPAPVQVTFAGYPGSTGLTTIDYRITDPHLDPDGMFDQFCSEKTHRLPHTFWCDDFDQPLPQVGSLPAAINGYITFGSLNNFCKINDSVLDLWIKILSQVHGSKLILLSPPGSARDRITERFEQAGVSRDRLEFIYKQPREDYLNTYNRIDICLDTFPYNGHATSFDALSMGVPVVTLVGQTIVGRAGFSLLSNLGMKEIAADSAEEYVSIAASIASDIDRLEIIRLELRQKMRNSPLGKVDAFTQDIESAYRTFWRNWCEGQNSK